MSQSAPQHRNRQVLGMRSEHSCCISRNVCRHINTQRITTMQSYDEADEAVEPIGTLQRALSRRGSMTCGVAASEPAAQLSFDMKKMLPHIGEEAGLSEEVTLSSPGATATVLRRQSMCADSSLVNRQQEDNADTTSGPNSATAPADDGNVAGTATAVDAVVVRDDGEKAAGEQLEEDDDEPPLTRGISSLAQSGSRNLGSSRKGMKGGAAAPRWEANMQLDLAEFDANSVQYLAEGAMCQVFLARKAPASMRLPDDALKAAEAEGVIIKTPTEGGPPMAENDLVIESLVMRELNHPNILRLLGGGTTGTGASFIALEYLSMGTLRKRLDSCSGGLGIQASVKHGQRLASALAYMHDDALSGTMIMHRDLKPDNIGFSASGVVKLMDFGLAKVIQRTLRSRSVKYKMTGETGSPRYMPPEVAQNQPYNEKADVWSFTIILWEMVSGRLPFSGMNMEMYLGKVCKGGQRPLMQHSWPADLKDVLQAGWQADPDKRPSFREIDAVLTDLQRDFNAPKKKGMFGRG